LGGLTINFTVHLVTALVTNGRSVPVAVGAGIMAGLAGTAILTAVGFSGVEPALADGAALAALNLVTYLALAFGYFNFVNLNMTSLRIRVLLELLEAKAGLSQ